MNDVEKIVYMMQGTMKEPVSWGWFHLMWIGLTVLSIIVLYLRKSKYGEKQLKTVLFTYGIVALVLELTKQIIWSFNYEPITNLVTWDYQWYAAPFQLCTTPIYVSLICTFLKNNKLRKSLLSYMSFITILGGLMTILMPDSCFVETIEVNIHTMWLHCGSFVVSIYLLMNGEVELKLHNLKTAFYTFLVAVSIALLLNIGVYNLGILNEETFDMFYISPYFISSLPIYDIIQSKVPYIIFLLSYISSIILGGFVVYGIAYFINKFIKHFKTL